MNNKNTKEKILIFTIEALIVFFMILVLMNYSIVVKLISKIIEALAPFAYGISFAYILSPLCNKIENIFNKVKHNRTLAVVITEAIFFIIIIIVSIIIIPQSVTSISNLMSSGQDIINTAQYYLDKSIENNKIITDIAGVDSVSIIDTTNKFFDNIITPNIDSIAKQVMSKLTDFGNTIIHIIIGVIISIFTLYNRKEFSKHAKTFILMIFKKEHVEILFDKIIYTNKIFSSFFIGKIIDSTIVGIITFIAMSIMNMPYSLLISAIICITNMIPMIGPFIGAIPSAIIILGEEPNKTLYFIIFILILQQIDGHVIGPKCIGKTTGLSTFWVIFAILLFGNLFGIIGMLIGVPLFAVIYDIVKNTVSNVVKKKDIKIPDSRDTT